MTYDPSQPQSTPPGWYPDESGRQRWWDGTRWTDAYAPLTAAGPGAATSSDTTLAALAHVIALITNIIGPLVMYLVVDRNSRFAKFHAAQALNFAITVLIAGIVSFILLFVLVGFLLLPLVGIWAFVMPIVAAVKAYQGEWYRYPLTIQFVSAD